jgi:hypothetical protein
MSPEKTAPDFHAVASEAATKHLFPTTFAQPRLWFLERLLPGNISYLIPWFLRISGRLNVAALKKNLNEIRERHEALRTTHSGNAGAPVQVVTGTLSMPMPVTVLSRVGHREERARRLRREQSGNPLDLDPGPLVRAQLLRRDEGEHVLFSDYRNPTRGRLKTWYRRTRFKTEVQSKFDMVDFTRKNRQRSRRCVAV